MKINLKVAEELSAPAKRLLFALGMECAEDGITVSAKQGERIGASLSDGEATIYYRDKVQFFRGLSILAENAARGDSFEITEDGFFENISAMIDASRCGVPTVDSIKRLLDRLALMGYTMMMLYTEDVLKLDGRPYFGYMRGRYTREELSQIDDYAYEYGIEVIPCLELYGHMEKYLIWPEASKIKDTAGVMMARSDDTFAFVDELVGFTSSVFRSKRIHIGMDEAWDMGRGNFLNKHGYVPPFEIFNEYMERLISITNKYGLTPMMWSDMYFRVETDNNAYYDEKTVIREETKKKIPKEVELVFWHYGEQPWCDDYMLKKHNELGRKVIYAGGNWGWIGHFPEHNYMMSTTRFSLNACRNNNVREAMLTVWCNDNAECDTFANLFSLSYFAELCYNKDSDKATLKSRFEATVGGDYDLFYKMSYYHNDFENGDDYPSYSNRFFGKPLFWQDILGGLYDKRLFDKPMSSHYAAAAGEFLGKGELKDGWGYLYEYAYRVFDYLAIKTLIAERLYPAYQEGNRELLSEIAETLLPMLKERTEAVHAWHRRIWFMNNKGIGWQNLDTRYGGMASRCDTAIMLIKAYLNGEIPTIEELDEPRLYKGLSGFIHYSGVNTVNLKT